MSKMTETATCSGCGEARASTAYLTCADCAEENDKALQEKDATIKALADALDDMGEVSAEGWHTPLCTLEGAGLGLPCTGRCDRARAALRLAGRL